MSVSPTRGTKHRTELESREKLSPQKWAKLEDITNIYDVLVKSKVDSPPRSQSPHSAAARDPKPVFIRSLKLAISAQQPDPIRTILREPIADQLSKEDWGKILVTVGKKTVNLDENGKAVLGLVMGLPMVSMKEKLEHLFSGTIQGGNRDLILHLTRAPDFKREMLVQIFRLIPEESNLSIWFANRFGTQLMSEILKQDSLPLLEQFLLVANDRTIYRAMLPVIAEQPVAALKMCEQLDGRNWIPDEIAVADILEILVSHYTPQHRELANVCFRLFEGRLIDKNDINYLFQKIAAPQERTPFPRQQFQEELVAWLLEKRYYPDPFAWGQAVWKCVDQRRRSMVEALWKATTCGAIPSDKLTREWQVFMKSQYSIQNDNEAYIKLVPLFFDYHPENSSLGRKELDEEVKYRNTYEEWLTALEFATVEKQIRIKNLILSIIIQKPDPKIIAGAIALLLEHKNYSLLDEIPSQALSRLSTLVLHDFIRETREIKYEPDVRKFEQRMSGIARSREVDE